MRSDLTDRQTKRIRLVLVVYLKKPALTARQRFSSDNTAAERLLFTAGHIAHIATQPSALPPPHFVIHIDMAIRCLLNN